MRSQNGLEGVGEPAELGNDLIEFRWIIVRLSQNVQDFVILARKSMIGGLRRDPGGEAKCRCQSANEKCEVDMWCVQVSGGRSELDADICCKLEVAELGRQFQRQEIVPAGLSVLAEHEMRNCDRSLSHTGDWECSAGQCVVAEFRTASDQSGPIRTRKCDVLAGHKCFHPSGIVRIQVSEHRRRCSVCFAPTLLSQSQMSENVPRGGASIRARRLIRNPLGMRSYRFDELGESRSKKWTRRVSTIMTAESSPSSR
ncbi:hypothetical protein [Nannocystis pusilla]|uniref:hypothetical protein n=1 Tax=Nannocystis pusilla TaxID=889268 RepID=UPI003B7A54B4